VVLGLVISKVANPFTDAVLVAITAGTFLYVGATEVCNEEFEDGTTNDKLIRFSALAGGMALIGLISTVSERWVEGGCGGH
jgi:zinc transporter 1/2/3